MTEQDARAEARARYQGDVDSATGAPVDDWGYANAQRDAFVAGAVWAASRSYRPPAEAYGTVSAANRLLGVNLWDAPSFRADVRIDFHEDGHIISAGLVASQSPTVAQVQRETLLSAAEAFGENQTIREGDVKEWLRARATGGGAA